MQMVALKASARIKDASPQAIRRTGAVPAVVYGNIENTLLQCEERDLTKAYMKAGESTLVEIELDGKKIPALFHAVDLHPVSNRVTHVDFYAVDMKKEVEADVQVRFEGESLAVKDHGAIIVHPMDSVLVRALPANLPHSIAADLSKLTEFGAVLTVADLPVPQGVTILTDPESVLAIAQQPREEEPEEVAAAPAEGAVGPDGQPIAAAAEGAAPAAEGAAPAADKKEE